MNQNSIDKWVIPFYLQINHFYVDEKKLTDSYLSVRDELTSDVITSLLGEQNWRPKITGAWFAAIQQSSEFKDRIKELLLESKYCYAGGGYLLALTSLGDHKSICEYLDSYLPKKDKHYDQRDAMHALMWIDSTNDTSLTKSYLNQWNEYCQNGSDPKLKPEGFFRNMTLIKTLGSQPIDGGQ